MMKHLLLGVCTVACLGLTTGCETQKRTQLLERDGHYWQRIDTSSAIYLRGPKAQQTLNQHISNCVVAVKELERLGAISKAIPGKNKGHDAKNELSAFETPDRVGFNRREHLEFHDFESCMFDKGWERVEFVPYNVADGALDTYQKTHSSFQKASKPTPQQRGDFDDLNDD